MSRPLKSSVPWWHCTQWAAWPISRLLVYRSKKRKKQVIKKNQTKNSHRTQEQLNYVSILKDFYLHSSCSVLLCPFLPGLCVWQRPGWAVTSFATFIQLHVDVSHCPLLGWSSTLLFQHQPALAGGGRDVHSEQCPVGQISGLEGHNRWQNGSSGLIWFWRYFFVYNWKIRKSCSKDLLKFLITSRFIEIFCFLATLFAVN